MRRTGRVAVALLLPAVVVTACTDEPEQAAAPPTSSSTPDQTSTTPTDQTPEPDPKAGGRWARAVNALVEDPYYPDVGEPEVDALHYDLELSWNPDSAVLDGVARIDFRAADDLTELQLDFGSPLAPSTVELDGTAVDVAHDDDLLLIDGFDPLPANSQHTLRIAYRGSPEAVDAPTTRQDFDGVGWHTMRDGNTWTMQEPYGAFTWYPVNDHPSDKAYYDMSIETPADVRGVAGGELVSDEVADGRRMTRFHLGDPAAAYLITLAIGDYRLERDTGPDGLPVSYWVRPEDSRFLPDLRRTPELLEWLTDLLGPFPFDHVGALITPSGTAMETQETISMGTRVPLRIYPEVLLHEYAHQWYGDTVTPDTWPDLWLNEAFATYLEMAWMADEGGRSLEEWQSSLEDGDQAMRDEDGPPGAYDEGEFAENSVYFSGMLMLLRIRDEVGEEAFDEVLRGWPEQQHGSTADRDEWVAFAEQTTGADLADFVDEWLTSETTPD